jgi:hypothetical protein
MHTPRQVPKLGQQRPAFGMDNQGRVPSPIMIQGDQQSPEAAVAGQLQELAMQIYSNLATAHIKHNIATDAETLRELAKAAQAAAKAYFEELGVRFDG